MAPTQSKLTPGYSNNQQTNSNKCPPPCSSITISITTKKQKTQSDTIQSSTSTQQPVRQRTTQQSAPKTSLMSQTSIDSLMSKIDLQTEKMTKIEAFLEVFSKKIVLPDEYFSNVNLNY